MSANWFRAWFGEEYLALYPHRDEEEAEEAVRLFLSRAALEPGAPVLDLACGAGRHLEAMADQDLRLAGLDLSLPLLRKANEVVGDIPLVRGDMRNLPFADGVFSAVTSFFTSFGYFAEAEDDRRVLGEVQRVLRRGGCFLLDFLNAGEVRRTLVPRDEGRVEGRRVIQERKLIQGGRVVEKRIRIEGRESREFVERVRLYDAEELEGLMIEAGLSTVERMGDYTGGALDPSSRRTILLARAEG